MIIIDRDLINGLMLSKLFFIVHIIEIWQRCMVTERQKYTTHKFV